MCVFKTRKKKHIPIPNLTLPSTAMVLLTCLLSLFALEAKASSPYYEEYYDCRVNLPQYDPDTTLVEPTDKENPGNGNTLTVTVAGSNVNEFYSNNGGGACTGASMSVNGFYANGAEVSSSAFSGSSLVVGGVSTVQFIPSTIYMSTNHIAVYVTVEDASNANVKDKYCFMIYKSGEVDSANNFCPTSYCSQY